MERQRPRRMKRTHLCIPRLKADLTCTLRSTNCLSPMTLLERFREAVFRLMVLSALSRTHNGESSGSLTPAPIRRSYQYAADDLHHIEAVADCIEFIKKTILSDGNNNRGSATEIVIPFTVM